MDTLNLPAPATRIFTENVIERLQDWRRMGLRCALVTLVGVDGSSPRRPGSQMAVAETGEALGYISSGCAEAAIIAEARDAIASGRNRTVRYGAGSKYIDVVLPCGSGIDVHFDVTVPDDVLNHLAGAIRARRPAILILDRDGDGPATLGDDRAPTDDPRYFTRYYTPPPRVVVAGRGVNVDFVARFAHELEWEVIAASPDVDTLDRVRPLCAHTLHLTSPADFDAKLIDSRTAVVLVFHDHDWEPPILARCAATPAFYVGALGSRRTHAQRVELLQMAGCPDSFIASIRGPVGLDIGGANPAEIALAITAEILSTAPAA